MLRIFRHLESLFGTTRVRTNTTATRIRPGLESLEQRDVPASLAAPSTLLADLRGAQSQARPTVAIEREALASSIHRPAHASLQLSATQADLHQSLLANQQLSVHHEQISNAAFEELANRPLSNAAFEELANRPRRR